MESLRRLFSVSSGFLTLLQDWNVLQNRNVNGAWPFGVGPHRYSAVSSSHQSSEFHEMPSGVGSMPRTRLFSPAHDLE